MADNLFTRIGRGFAKMGGQDLDADPAIATDEDGEFEKAAPRALGSAGIVQTGGYLVTDERLPDLIGPKRWDTFNRMLSDITIIAASVRLYLNLIAKSSWQVTPADTDDLGENAKAEAQRIADLVEDMMRDHATPWATIVRKQALYRFLGFTIQEWTAKKRADGAIGIDDVEHRPQKTIARWDVDESGTVNGVWQQNSALQEVYLPRDRLIYSVDNTMTDNPEGMGLIRNVVRAATRLKAFEQLEEVGFETDLRGVPVAYGPWEELDAKVKAGTLTEQDRRAYRKPMIDFVTGHIRSKRTGLLLPSETFRSTDDGRTPSSVRKWAAELLQGDSSAFEPMGKAIERLTWEIAVALGTEHLTLGKDGGGSLALGKAKTGTFYLNVTSAQYELVETFERDWLGPIAELNGWDPDFIPTLAIEEVRDQDIDQVTKALADLANAGAMLTSDDPAVAEVRAMLGLSPPPEDLALPLNSTTTDPIDPAQQPSAVDLPDQPEGIVKRVWIRSRKGQKRHG